MPRDARCCTSRLTLHSARADLFQAERRKLRKARSVFDGHADQVAGRVKVDVDVFRDLSRLIDQCGRELDERRVSVPKIFDFHGENLRSKKAL